MRRSAVKPFSRFNVNPTTLSLLLSFVVLALSTASAEEPTKVEGLIVARSGDEIIVEYMSGAELAFLLDDTTKVSQVEGVLKARRKDMSMAALVPGLKVKVEGTRNQNQQLVATKVTFKGDDLKNAQSAEAATRQSREAQQAELEKQSAALKAQNEQLQVHEAQLAEQKANIDAAVARFGQLDDYYIFDEVTVYFANGKVQVESKYETPLLTLAEKAKAINGYVIEVKGYASATGSTSVNQKLSEDRANNVTNVLLQKGKIPLTRLLAPGAMGESDQVGNDKTPDGQAENRRVVVRVLQNKAIAGI
jgi:outer membrane protein OmpA-like peptidoglycan-associated protein